MNLLLQEEPSRYKRDGSEEKAESRSAIPKADGAVGPEKLGE